MKQNANTECLTLWLYIQPNATKTAFSGHHEARIKIKVAARAIDNQANTTLIKWLALQFGVSQKQVNVAQGETSRYKKVVIHNPQSFPDTWPWMPAEPLAD
jgi:uncharacterized protein